MLGLHTVYRDRQIILKLAEVSPWQVNTEQIQLSHVYDLRQWPQCCLSWLQQPCLSVPRNTSEKTKIEISPCWQPQPLQAEVCVLLLHWADSRKSRMLKWLEAIAFCFYLEKRAVWFIVLTSHLSGSWAPWQKAKHTKETTVKLSSATRSREKVPKVITYCACLHCNKWQLLRAAIWTTGPLEELQFSAASLGQAGPQHLFSWPLSKGPLWLQAKRCFAALTH